VRGQKRNRRQISAEQQLLERIINEAGLQLDAVKPNIDAVATLLEGYEPESENEPLLPASDFVADGVPEMPSGPAIAGLQKISDAAGGVFGLWIVAGEPGIGKSTFIDQVIYSLLKHDKVLKYDYENGPELLLARMFIAAEAANRRKELVRRLERLFIRPDIRSLGKDLQTTPPPATIVVDAFQSLPTDIRTARSGFTGHLLRFEKLARAGYRVILVSEKQRAMYGKASLAGFKESGDIEYKAWFGVQLVGDYRDSDAPVEVHVVKNRCRPTKGHICDLYRDQKLKFWFNEDTAEDRETDLD